MSDQILAWIHGAFYIATGLWPIVHIKSFETVSGPKLEHWLVRTVGALIVVIGAVILISAFRPPVVFEVKLLAIGSALVLAGVDLIYSLSGRISKVYLLDAVVEIPLAALWTVSIP